MVKDIWPAGTAYPHYLVNVNGTLYFRANDGIHGVELWKSDGTAQGTLMVKDIVTGAADTWIDQLLDVNGTLYFQADDTVAGRELWKSDGTPTGTLMVADIRPGPMGSMPTHLAAWLTTLYVRANDGLHGDELWSLPTVEFTARVYLPVILRAY
jgi:ELWxxDGT repeat protein